MQDGFQTAMIYTAALAAAGGVIGFATIRPDVLDAEPSADGDSPERAATDRQCPIAGPGLRPSREADCAPPVPRERVTVSVGDRD